MVGVPSSSVGANSLRPSSWGCHLSWRWRGGGKGGYLSYWEPDSGLMSQSWRCLELGLLTGSLVYLCGTDGWSRQKKEDWGARVEGDKVAFYHVEPHAGSEWQEHLTPFRRDSFLLLFISSSLWHFTSSILLINFSAAFMLARASSLSASVCSLLSFLHLFQFAVALSNTISGDLFSSFLLCCYIF